MFDLQRVLKEAPVTAAPTGWETPGAVTTAAPAPTTPPPITATTATPAPAGLGLWGVGVGMVCLLAGAFWGVYAYFKKKPKTIPGALVAVGFLGIFIGTRTPEARKYWGDWIARKKQAGGVDAILGFVAGLLLKGVGVVETPAAQLPALTAATPPTTTTTPPPAPSLQPPVDTQQTQPAQGQPQDGPILIDPERAQQGTAAATGIDKRLPLRWPDGTPDKNTEQSATWLRSRVYNGADDALQGAFNTITGRLGPWWASAARSADSPSAADRPKNTAIKLAQAWFAAEPQRARDALNISNVGLGYMEFDGVVIPFRVPVTPSKTTPTPTPLPTK